MSYFNFMDDVTESGDLDAAHYIVRIGAAVEFGIEVDVGVSFIRCYLLVRSLNTSNKE